MLVENFKFQYIMSKIHPSMLRFLQGFRENKHCNFSKRYALSIYTCIATYT